LYIIIYAVAFPLGILQIIISRLFFFNHKWNLSLKEFVNKKIVIVFIVPGVSCPY